MRSGIWVEHCIIKLPASNIYIMVTNEVYYVLYTCISFIDNFLSLQFDKQYSYSIRYNYGREGKKTNFSAYGCIKIIMSNPAATDAHGCPFKHMDDVNLRKRLSFYKVSDEGERGRDQLHQSQISQDIIQSQKCG